MTITVADYGFFLAVFLGAITQTVAGFGFMMVSLTGAALLMPVSLVVPAALPLSMSSAAVIAWRERAHADHPLLFRQVLPVMGVTGVIGYLLAGGMDGALLRRLLGVVVLFAVVLGVWQRGRTAKPWPSPLRVGVIAAAGVIQGMFGTGGPLLVMALERVGLPARTFRATLITVWPILNFFIVLGFVLEGRLDRAALFRIAVAAPLVILGVRVGELVHARLSPARFRQVVYLVLGCAGLTLLLR